MTFSIPGSRCQLQKSSKNRPGSSGRLATRARPLGDARFSSIASSTSARSSGREGAADAHRSVATKCLDGIVHNGAMLIHSASVEDGRPDRVVTCPLPSTDPQAGRTTRPASRARSPTHATSNRTPSPSRRNRRARGRALAPLPGRDGRRDRRGADDASPGRHDRSRRRRVLRAHALFDHLRPWGINAVEYDQTGAPPAGADLILIEAPSNPMLTMPDFEAAAAHAAPVICDATLASPFRLRPARRRV